MCVCVYVHACVSVRIHVCECIIDSIKSILTDCKFEITTKFLSIPSVFFQFFAVDEFKVWISIINNKRLFLSS